MFVLIVCVCVANICSQCVCVCVCVAEICSQLLESCVVR